MRVAPRTLRFVGYGGSAGGWSAAAGADVAAAHLGVLFGSWKIDGRFAAEDGFLEQPFQKWPAPAAAGACAKTFAELRGAFGFFDANEVDDFALGDVKAEAKFVVEVHTA